MDTSTSASVLPIYSELISVWIDGLDLLAVQGTLKSFLQHHSLKAYTPWNITQLLKIIHLNQF